MEIEKIRKELSEHNVNDFEIIHQNFAIKSREDAIGIFKIEETAPTLILKTDTGFYSLIISGERKRVNFKELKKLLGRKKLEMAKKEEIVKEFSVEAGEVPLVGLGLPCIFDNKLLSHKYVYGGTGDWNYTLKINPNDLIKANNVILFID